MYDNWLCTSKYYNITCYVKAKIYYTEPIIIMGNFNCCPDFATGSLVIESCLGSLVCCTRPTAKKSSILFVFDP